jgi:ribose 5-phosphate isomerase B
MTIYFGADHAGFKLKEALKRYVASLGHRVVDLGAKTYDSSDDYPDFVIPAARAAVRHHAHAIVLGGSGVGECIAANKVRGARAAMAYDAYTARMSRRDTDTNVLCLGGRTAVAALPLAKLIVRTWLATKFSGAARHRRRLKKLPA